VQRRVKESMDLYRETRVSIDESNLEFLIVEFLRDRFRAFELSIEVKRVVVGD